MKLRISAGRRRKGEAVWFDDALGWLVRRLYGCKETRDLHAEKLVILEHGIEPRNVRADWSVHGRGRGCRRIGGRRLSRVSSKKLKVIAGEREQDALKPSAGSPPLQMTVGKIVLHKLNPSIEQ
jgi:hypothetical protein